MLSFKFENLLKSMALAIELNNVSKAYALANNRTLEVLNGVDMGIARGEFVSILGPSGSGKSTLLYLTAGIDSPDSGEVVVAGESVKNKSETWLAEFRAKNIGFIYQFFGLLPTLTALENVMLPMSFKGIKPKDALLRARDLLDQVGLSDRFDHRPNSLSGGEQQRVAVARALAPNPEILLADEPTGNLDRKTGKNLLKVLADLVEDEHTSLLAVTHDMELANISERRLRLVNGKLEEN